MISTKVLITIKDNHSEVHKKTYLLLQIKLMLMNCHLPHALHQFIVWTVPGVHQDRTVLFVLYRALRLTALIYLWSVGYR